MKGIEDSSAGRRATYGTFFEAAVAIQEQSTRLTLGMIGNSARALAVQAGTMRLLAEQSRALWAGTHFGPAAEGTSRRVRDEVPGLPIDDYDRLNVEELGHRLQDLRIQDIERLKAHERQVGNRRAMMERLDRALV